jgi:hypothetical protein
MEIWQSDEPICEWQLQALSENVGSVILCNHPLMRGFRDYPDDYDWENCPYFKLGIEEPSEAEEEVRQYLEYTEGSV